MNEEAEKDALYNLPIHNSVLVESDREYNVHARRVPGGWIYTETYDQSGTEEHSCAITTTFVPWIDRIDA